MCMICAAIPATAALGAKLNADQLRRDQAHRLPVPKMTATVIGLLVIASAVSHTLRWES